MRVAAIDQGTTSTRVLMLDERGQPEIVHGVEHRQIYPQPGWVEHDPEELIRIFGTCFEAAGDVDAIGIDNQGESCLAWDAEDKTALSPVIVWQDDRTKETVQQLKADGIEAETLARAGLPLDPYFSATKLAWILETLPSAKEAHTKGRLRLGTTDAFFLDRLTGFFVTDITTASRTSLMNLENGTWDEELCRIFGVPIETLPEIRTTTGDFGAISTSSGLKPVTASVVDQQAALYGFGCRHAGDAKMTFGTGAFALMVTGQDIHRQPDQGLLPTVAWQKAGEAPIYALEGGVYAAGAAVNWAKSLGLFSDLSDLNNMEGAAAIDGGLAFVPALSGLACPHWDRRARGTWLGLSLDHEKKDLARAVLEGIAFRAAEVLQAMARAVPLNEALMIDGGMSKNPYFAQFLADLLGRDVRPSQVADLTAVGTALLAADPLQVDFPEMSAFTSVQPKQDRTAASARFQQAIALTRSWKST
ncbi:MAG: FGGY-family carbohydrate kinase [Geminicoccales bacterium]